MFITSATTSYTTTFSPNSFTVRPLEVEILFNNQPLSADRQYEVECQAIGSRPPSVITWWMNEIALVAQPTKVNGFLFLLHFPALFNLEIACVLLIFNIIFSFFLLFLLKMHRHLQMAT